jgi:DNA-binding transcriptional ArsR family regulator
MTDSYVQADLSAMVEKKAAAIKACSMLKILANEDRLMILCQLVQGKRNVGELEQLLGIRQPTLSQQLTVLREEKLVSTERKGKYIYYSLTSREAVQIIGTLFDLYCGSENQQVSDNTNNSDKSCRTISGNSANGQYSEQQD